MLTKASTSTTVASDIRRHPFTRDGSVDNHDRMPVDSSSPSIQRAGRLLGADAIDGTRTRMQRAIREYVETLSPSGVELAAAVGQFTRARRDGGARAEEVVVEVKREAALALGVPRDLYSLYRRTPFARLVEQLVTWAVDAYYGEGK